MQLYHQAACRILTSFSQDFAVGHAISAGFVTRSLYTIFFLKKECTKNFNEENVGSDI